MKDELMLKVIQLFYSDEVITEAKLSAILIDNNTTDLTAILEGSNDFYKWVDILFRYDILRDINAYNHFSQEYTFDDYVSIKRVWNETLSHKENLLLKKCFDNTIKSIIIHKENKQVKNYDGIILSLLDFFKNNSELTEKELTQLIKSILIVSQNQTDILDKIKIGGTNFFNTLILSIQKILIEQNTITINSKERLYSPLEVANILGVTKATIINHIDEGLISKTKYIQKMKGGKIQIYSSGIDDLIIEKTKYANRWLNRNL